MAAGQGYIEFATGDVLTAATANGYLASQVVMVFASASARTSAIASPQEGMISYLKDTNSVEYYSGSAWTAVGGGGLSSPLTTKGDVWGYSTTNARVAVGTNGQVLTADSTESTGVKWATPAGGGGWTSLASGSCSGSSVSLSSISGSYKNLRLVLRNVQISNSTEPGIRVNSDTANNYSRWAGIQAANVATGSAQYNASYVYTTYNTPKPNSIGTWIVDLPDYANSSSYKIITCNAYYVSGASGNAPENVFTEGAWASTSAITAVSFFLPSYSFSAGTYELLGGN